MTERTDTQSSLVRLSDSEDVRLQFRTQDVRGLHVYDSNGEQIGSVENLYVDEEKREVRFLDVAAGGFLGIGEKHFLIPVEAVTEVGEDSLTVDRSRQKVVDSPPFDTSVMPRASYQRDIYDYYGYSPRRPDAGPGAWPGGI